MAEVRLIQGGAVRLAYREYDAAPDAPVILLHALGETGDDWARVAAELSGSWHVYAVDLRGHGRSDWPGTYTLPPGFLARPAPELTPSPLAPPVPGRTQRVRHPT